MSGASWKEVSLALFVVAACGRSTRTVIDGVDAGVGGGGSTNVETGGSGARPQGGTGHGGTAGGGATSGSAGRPWRPGYGGSSGDGTTSDGGSADIGGTGGLAGADGGTSGD